jgi:hypothetical protein
MPNLSEYAKCILAALVAGYGAYQAAMTDHIVTQAEWVQIILAVVTAGAIVWGVPNAAKPAPVVLPYNKGGVLPSGVTLTGVPAPVIVTSSTAPTSPGATVLSPPPEPPV